MERIEWLRQMRIRSEQLYDHFSLLYWVKFGKSMDETHQVHLQEFLKRIDPHSHLLSAACGAGTYDGILLEAGHSVVGIDQSEGMLARAREHFPRVRYEKVALQEMTFRDSFDGATCIDAMEHVPPEDWPDILGRFRQALKPGGWFYFTVDLGGDHVAEAYQRALALGLPVVFGEVADHVEGGSQTFMNYEDVFEVPDSALTEQADSAVYHYCPPLDQVRAWVEAAGFTIELEGPGKWYQHFLVRAATI